MAAFNANVYCVEELARGLHNQLVCLSVFNIVLGVATIAANTLILMALSKENSLHPPSKVLLRSLVASDLCVGIVEITTVIYWISMMQECWQMCRYFYFAHAVGGSISFPSSLWTITAISVDRLLALLLGLRYRQVVTLRRVYVVAIACWVCHGFGSAVVGFYSYNGWEIFIATGILLCLMTSIYCYTRIFLRLRHHQTHVQDIAQEQANQTLPTNLTRYKKTVTIAMWLQLALVVCYFPYVVVAPLAFHEIQTRQSSAHFLALYSTITLMCLNSILNPVLYCWKIKEVRIAVKDTLKQLSFSTWTS